MKDIYYYSQGFKFHRSLSLVDFISTLNENKIVISNRVKIYFKSGSKTEDFRELLKESNSKVDIDSNKTLTPKRNLLLEHKYLKFNNRTLKIRDLDDRVINYIVSEDKESVLLEDHYSTTWVAKKSDVENSTNLKSLLDLSKYVEWDSYPVDEYYSYKYVNTANSTSKSSTNSLDISSIPTVISKHNNPINFSTFTKWRLEYSKVLLGFYENISSQLKGYSIYMEGKPLVELDKLNSKRVDLSLLGFGNLSRHPFIYDHDLHQTKADLSIKIRTTDQLEFMGMKKKYQNYEFLSNLVTFQVLDRLELPWTNHVWWEPYNDMSSLGQNKDEEGRFSYTMELRCSLYFYEVEDEMFQTIDKIKVIFKNLPKEPTFIHVLKS